MYMFDMFEIYYVLILKKTAKIEFLIRTGWGVRTQKVKIKNFKLSKYLLNRVNMQIRLPLLAFSNTGIYHYNHDVESQF